MNEYDRGFEDALALVHDYMQKYKDNLPENFVLSIKEIIQNAKDKKIADLKKEFNLIDAEVLPAKDKKTNK